VDEGDGGEGIRGGDIKHIYTSYPLTIREWAGWGCNAVHNRDGGKQASAQGSREHTYKFVKDAIEEAGGEALPADLCHFIDDDITERFQHVMRMKPIMRPVTVLSRTNIELVQT
jgi:hypothetical protein